MVVKENSKIINNKTDKRIYYLDILRVLACLAVIMIHASNKYIEEDFGTFNFWISNIFDSLSRIAVPLFVMISGTLMLDENYNFSTKKLKKHITKMISFFIFWSGAYCLIFQIIRLSVIKHEPLDVVQTMINFIAGHYHLWFIYLIIGLYLIVPLLRLWVKDENKKWVEYFIILSIIFTYIIPQVISIGTNYSIFFEALNNIIEKELCLKYVGGFTTYFILGWYVHNYDIKSKKIIYILGIVGFVITCISTYVRFAINTELTLMYGNLTVNVFLQALAIFVFIKTKFNNIECIKNKFITLVSKYSLGIYAIHAGILTIIHSVLIKIGFENSIIGIPIIFGVSFIGAFAGTYILSKIPILKKFI